MTHIGELALRATLSLLCAGYFLVALLIAIFGVAVTQTPDRLRLSQNPMADVLLRESTKRPLTARMVGSLQALSIAVGWPLINRGRANTKDKAMMKMMVFSALRPYDAQSASTTLFGSFVLSGLAALNLVWTPVSDIAFIVLVTSIFLREISYLISSLPQRLRQSIYNPISGFLVIAACGFSRSHFLCKFITVPARRKSGVAYPFEKRRFTSSTCLDRSSISASFRRTTGSGPCWTRLLRGDR